ncbi:MAG: hypothetical protein QOI63_324 [Thermoplasmata archaeon]|jgi:hypothetical protein|nr:hypothetical protein [Thermoplasmata archaeon]
MRALLPLALLLALALAGCASTPAGTSSTSGSPAPATLAPLPKDIAATQAVMGAADPVNVSPKPDPNDPLPAAPCATPPSKCFSYPFTVNGTAKVAYDAKLTWGLAASDFDLYLYKDGKVVASSAAGPEGNPLGGMPPGTIGEHLTDALDPGSYVLVVDPFAVSQDSYTLTVAFTR